MLFAYLLMFCMLTKCLLMDAIKKKETLGHRPKKGRGTGKSQIPINDQFGTLPDRRRF